jgi:hypothetical protein
MAVPDDIVGQIIGAIAPLNDDIATAQSGLNSARR